MVATRRTLNSVSLLCQAIASRSKGSFVPPVQPQHCLRILTVTTQAITSLFVLHYFYVSA